MSKVLVVGGGGYVGSQLVPRLIALQHFVTVLDTFWYGQNQFKEFGSKSLRLMKADLRNSGAVERVVADQDIIIHLACISNDPSFDLDPKLGRSVNLDSFLPFVEAAKRGRVSRFIYASSSSVYGIKSDEKVTEDLTLEPLTDYSKFKAQCEKLLMQNTTDEFVTTILRPATICGYSSRQRFDLIVNILTAHAILNNRITVNGGTQFRPNLHIEDMVDSYLRVMEADEDSVHREVFNVGGKNMTLTELAQVVQSTIDVDIPIDYMNSEDLRSYRIDSTKIKEKIGFSPTREVKDAVHDLKIAFEKGAYTNALRNPAYINIMRMKELALG